MAKGKTHSYLVGKKISWRTLEAAWSLPSQLAQKLRTRRWNNADSRTLQGCACGHLELLQTTVNLDTPTKATGVAAFSLHLAGVCLRLFYSNSSGSLSSGGLK